MCDCVVCVLWLCLCVMPTGDGADNASKLGHHSSVAIVLADRSVPVAVGVIDHRIGSDIRSKTHTMIAQKAHIFVAYISTAFFR